MKKQEVITINEDEQYLRQIPKPVDLSDIDLKQDLEILEKYCKENEVLALAAVQVGIPKRIIYLKNTDLEIINKW